MENSKIKIGITSTAVAVACVGAAYAFLRYKYRVRDAVDALKYLNIKTVTSEDVCDELVQELRKRSETYRAVGFDCEWVTEQGRRLPVALVQLSSYDGLCGLFRLNQLKAVPKSLKDLLEDETIYKVGVAPCDDGRYLQQDYGVNLKATLDVRHLAELCGYNAGGLASLSKSLLNVVLDKSWRIRCSDWEAESLTERQINYAAADAHVAIRMLVKLVQRHHKGTLSLFSRRNSDIWKNLDDLCWKYADVIFKTKQKANLKKDAMMTENEGNTKRVQKKYSALTRQKPLYHNCFMEAPDGERLCTCDTGKAMWYVDKQLADVISEEPLTVRLRFEPAGRSAGDVGRYYQLTKENVCVVCGRSDSYIRKNVVPREYRKYFPEIMKDRTSHDVLLLCVSCHQTSNARDQAVRARLARTCGAPYADARRFTEDVDCKKIRSAARALLYQSQKHDLPESRRRELEAVVLRHYPHRTQLTQELLQEAANIQFVIENTDYESHGQKVVEHYLKQEGGLLKLEELWRHHFLSSMRPRRLPALWSATHNEDRLRVRQSEGRLNEEDLKLIGLSRWL